MTGTAAVPLSTSLAVERTARPGPDLDGWRRLPGWAQVLLVFAMSRVLFTFVAMRNADMARPHAGGRHWTYWEIANNWDGTWYERVAVHGYPSQLPVGPSGAVTPNTWAFYPLFPRLVQLVEGAGLSWTAAATVTSVVCAAGAVVLVRSVTAQAAGPVLGFWTAALLCFFPAAAVLQLPYSEALALLLLTAVLRCLQRGWYLAAVPLVLLTGLARPIGVPVAAVVTVHVAGQVWALRGRLRPVPGGPLQWLAVPRAALTPAAVLRAGGLLLVWGASAVAAVAWPAIAWWRTGVPDGYTRTMASWRSPAEVVPFRSWWRASQFFLGVRLGPVVLVAGGLAVAWWLWRGRRVLGPDLTAWCACYCGYLLAVLDSFTSLPRYLLLLFPLGTLLASASGSRAYRIAVTTGFGALGVVWMLAIWRSHGWSP